MQDADIAMVYYNPETVKHKKLEEVSPEQVQAAFGHKKLEVFTNLPPMLERLKRIQEEKINFLFMSSGNFGGIDLVALARELI
jgi:UDP-N-acetylmuramate: L-alanyl-gamma-D-glutamyl-meso-diaminopimelate ligase